MKSAVVAVLVVLSVFGANSEVCIFKKKFFFLN